MHPARRGGQKNERRTNGLLQNGESAAGPALELELELEAELEGAQME